MTRPCTDAVRLKLQTKAGEVMFKMPNLHRKPIGGLEVVEGLQPRAEYFAQGF